MQRIIFSFALITIVTGALAFGATNAFFSDTETSTGNVFTAGTIDLQVDNESYYNGVLNASTTWEQVDLTVEKFFDFLDLKPDDYGEDTISLHVATNDAYICADVTLTSNDDNGINEPESEVDVTDGAGNGELADQVNFIWWADDGDNVFESDEEVISTGNFGQLGVGNSYPLTLADSDENVWTGIGGPVDGNETYYLGKAWCFGEIGTSPITQDNESDDMSPAGNNNGNAEAGEPEDGGITCDGTLLGNETQTDSLTADVSFYAVQSRHNENFQCDADQGDRTTLTLVKQLFSPENAPTDWELLADGPVSFAGVSGSGAVTNVDVLAGDYDLSEDGPENYEASLWNCDGGVVDVAGDTVTIAEGEQVTCTIINYIACEDPSLQYADRVVSSAQGVRKDGGPIALNRTNASTTLGMPQHPLGMDFDSPVVAGSFFSLGFNPDTNINFDGGKIVIEFVNNFLIDGAGNDLKMWEVTGGTSYPVEKIKIEVSQDNSTWFEVESSVNRDAEADLANSGLAWARYVRLTDVSDRNEFEAAADGYDLDAFSALTCADRTNLIN